MRYIIHDEACNDDVVRLALHCTDEGGVVLVAVDENGVRLSQGSLLSLTGDGRLRRHQLVNSNLGFDLDDKERIELAEE